MISSIFEYEHENTLNLIKNYSAHGHHFYIKRFILNIYDQYDNKFIYICIMRNDINKSTKKSHVRKKVIKGNFKRIIIINILLKKILR